MTERTQELEETLVHSADDGEETAEGRRKGANQANKKSKLVITLPSDAPVVLVAQTLKERGAKIEVGDLICEALAEVPEEWWEQKKEQLTPLEFKIQQALKDPVMRDRLQSFLLKDSTNSVESNKH